MVFWFKSSAVDPPATIYMGRDKYENDEMLRFGRESDIWFHVDGLSSAHVYLQLQSGWTFDTIPPDVVEDCCQLVKYNSIEGNKKQNVKDPDMDVGVVAFHSPKLCRYQVVERRNNDIINRLLKTRSPDEQFDWPGDKAKRVAEEKARRRALFDAQKQEQERKEEELTALRQARAYTNIFAQEEKMQTNKFKTTEEAKRAEEDFF